MYKLPTIWAHKKLLPPQTEMSNAPVTTGQINATVQYVLCGGSHPENYKDLQNKTYPPLHPKNTRNMGENIEKANTFTKHLAKIVQPHPSENELEEKEALTHLLDTPYHNIFELKDVLQQRANSR
jgi:hypothetical protein